MDAIGRLENIGYRFTLDGDQIHYTLAPGHGQPDSVIVKPLLEELRTHKQEAITFLRQREQGPADQALIIGAADEMNALGAACRERLRRQGYCLVKSQALGGEIIAAVDSDHRRRLAPAGHVVYTLTELELLAEGVRAGHIVSIGDLRLLHEAKKRLGGVVVR